MNDSSVPASYKGFHFPQEIISHAVWQCHVDRGVDRTWGVFGIVYNRVLRLTADFGLPIYAGLAYGVIVWLITSLGVLDTLMVHTTVFGMCLAVSYTIIRPLPYRNTREWAGFDLG